jgi:hypothetical protein
VGARRKTHRVGEGGMPYGDPPIWPPPRPRPGTARRQQSQGRRKYGPGTKCSRTRNATPRQSRQGRRRQATGEDLPAATAPDLPLDPCRRAVAVPCPPPPAVASFFLFRPSRPAQRPPRRLD